jgi:amino acid permease
MLYSNLMYGEIILRTGKKCGLVGYAHHYLGRRGKRLATIVSFFSLCASNLVYIILGGVFLDSFFGPWLGGNEFIYATVTFVFAALATYANFRFFSLIESWMVLFLLVVLFAVIGKCLPVVDAGNFLPYDCSRFFLPFGSVLFALSAGIAIPEMVGIMKDSHRRLKDAIGWGTVLYTILYIFFIVAVLGVTGKGTTEETFLGLSRSLGDGVVTLGFIFGFLTVITSYLVSNLSLKDIFWYDYKLGERQAWLLASCIPYLIYLSGLRDFIQVITIAGSITGGFFGILIIILFYVAKEKGDRRPAYELHVSEELSALMIFIYMLGIAYQFIYGW